jgi:hypothetical protein
MNKNCGTLGPSATTPAEEVEKWNRRVALADAAQAPQPDCWAILTPNGSRLVSPEEAKGRRDAYPLYAAPVAAPAPEGLGWVSDGEATYTLEAAAQRGKTYQARAYAAASKALARLHEICLRYGCGDEVMHEWLERTLASAAPVAPATVANASPVELRFPTMLRKMWSGGEVQSWLDELPPLYEVPTHAQGGNTCPIEGAAAVEPTQCTRAGAQPDERAAFEAVFAEEFPTITLNLGHGYKLARENAYRIWTRARALASHATAKGDHADAVAWQQRRHGGQWEFCSEESAWQVEGDEGIEVRALYTRAAVPQATVTLSRPEGEDPMADGQRTLEQSFARLTKAYSEQQPPPVPDQMALVWRFDIGRLRNDWIRLNAWQKSVQGNAATESAAQADEREGLETHSQLSTDTVAHFSTETVDKPVQNCELVEAKGNHAPIDGDQIRGASNATT